MVHALLVVLLQSSAPAVPQPDLPVSLDRVRQGLARPSRFAVPPARPWQRLFRTKVEALWQPEGNAWDDTSLVPLWVQPSMPAFHMDFLQTVTPEQVRAPAIYPCCDVMPLVSAVSDFVGKRIQAIKQNRAKREVENAMKAAGIRK